jgi:hypothetical protein
MIELIEELAMVGGGFGLFTGCAPVTQQWRACCVSAE